MDLDAFSEIARIFCDHFWEETAQKFHDASLLRLEIDLQAALLTMQIEVYDDGAKNTQEQIRYAVDYGFQGVKNVNIEGNVCDFWLEMASSVLIDKFIIDVRRIDNPFSTASAPSIDRVHFQMDGAYGWSVSFFADSFHRNVRTITSRR